MDEKFRKVDLTNYRLGSEVTISRCQNIERVTRTYNIGPWSEHRLNAVLEHIKADRGVSLEGGSLKVVVYFWEKGIRLFGYRPPYWAKGWREIGNEIVWENKNGSD